MGRADNRRGRPKTTAHRRQTRPRHPALTATTTRSKTETLRFGLVLINECHEFLRQKQNHIPLMSTSCISRQVDTNSKNVFGQPRLRASLRDLRSPRRTYKSTIEDDLKKLIIMDNPGEMPQRDPVRKTPALVMHRVRLQSLFVLDKLTL